MDLPTNYALKFDAPPQGKPRNEREELLDKFIDRLNGSRVKAGYKAMTHARLAKLLEGVPTADLYPFYRTCLEARSFGAMFWFKLKPKA